MVKPSAQKDKPVTANQTDSADLASILAETTRKLQPMMADMVSKMDWDIVNRPIDPLNLRQAWITFFQKFYQDPERLAALQMQYMKDWMALWGETTKRFMGHPGQELFQPE